MQDFPPLKSIQYPDCVLSRLKEIERVQPLEPGDADRILETGFFPGTVDQALNREFLLYVLVDVLNDVIASLNIIIADMEALPWLSPRQGRAIEACRATGSNL